MATIVPRTAGVAVLLDVVHTEDDREEGGEERARPPVREVLFPRVCASMEVGPEDVSLLERCPHFSGCYVQASMELGPEDVSLLERCLHFRGCYVQASMELEPEDVPIERCPHFRGCYVQASMELGPEDVSL